MKPIGRAATTALAFAIMGVIGILLEIIPAGVGPESWPSPSFLVLVTSLWLTQAPGAAPLWLIFALGLLRDTLTGVTLGAGALPLLGMAVLIRAPAARAGKAGFIPRFLLLMLFAGGVALGQWALVGLSRLSMPGMGAVVMQYGLTLAVFPVVSAFFRRVLRLGH